MSRWQSLSRNDINWKPHQCQINGYVYATNRVPENSDTNATSIDAMSTENPERDNASHKMRMQLLLQVAQMNIVLHGRVLKVDVGM